MTHPYNDHSSAGHYIQTGHPWHVPIGGGFNATEKDWPTYGSVVDYLDERSASAAPARDMPGFVYLPNRLGHLQTYSTKLDRPGQYAGWLGRGYDPLATAIGKRNDKDNPFYRDCTDEELDFPHSRARARTRACRSIVCSGRRSLVDQFDAGPARCSIAAEREAAYDQFRQRALSLVSSEKVRTALDIRQESAAMRDRYGRHLFGQSTLLARRLVEAGTRFVTVAWDAPDGYGWDSHTHERRRQATTCSRAGPGAVGAADAISTSAAARRDAGRGAGRDGTHAQGQRPTGAATTGARCSRR